MAFKLPSFNLLCRIWHQTNFPLPPFYSQEPCQLRVSPRPTAASAGNLPKALLMLPKKTDIRGTQSGPIADVVEVPAFSGRYYRVQFVDDVAKGFANEYRVASINPITGPPWPLPYP